MRGFGFRYCDRPALDLRALLMAGLAVRELHRRDASVDVADHMARLGEAYADSTAAIIDALIDATEREQRFLRRFRSWRKKRARPSSGCVTVSVARGPESHSSDGASHSSRPPSGVFDLASDESRPEDSESQRAWHESHPEDSESEPGSDEYGGASDESRPEDSESQPRSDSRDRERHPLVVVPSAAIVGAQEVEGPEAVASALRGYRQIVRLRGSLVRIPRWMRAVPLDLRCPHCGYDGEAAPHPASLYPAGGFVTKHALIVYHAVLGLGEDRGSKVVFINRDSYEEDPYGLSEKGQMICANCEVEFPLPYPVLDVSVVDS